MRETSAKTAGFFSWQRNTQTCTCFTCEKNRQERREASIKIQAKLRGFKARKHVISIREDKRKQELFDASVKIQSRVRGYKARKTTSTLKNKRAQHIASSKIQSNWRRRKASVDYSEKRKAAVKLQSIGRGWAKGVNSLCKIMLQSEFNKWRYATKHICTYFITGNKSNCHTGYMAGIFFPKSNFDYHKFVSARKHQYIKSKLTTTQAYGILENIGKN